MVLIDINKVLAGNNGLRTSSVWQIEPTLPRNSCSIFKASCFMERKM